MASGTFYPAVSGDDGAWKPGSFDASAGRTLIFGHQVSNYYHTFIRFPNITISSGCTIDSAYVKFSSDGSVGTDCDIRISCNDVDNAVAPTNEAEADGLVLTTVFVDWNNIPTWTDGVWYDTSDIASVIQEIINRGGWSSGNAITVLLKNNGSGTNSFRIADQVEADSGAKKAELHVTWEESPTTTFTFTDPIPVHLSTVYGTTKQLQLTTTLSGVEESYIYNASFYDESDVQIGTTISGINSGSPAISNVDFPTPSGIDYSWYVTATSSGSEDTSSTYTFSNRFLYEGYITENNDPISRTVRLYYRDTGELLDTVTSSGINGYYKFEASNNNQHFIIAFDDEAGEDYNALILDRLLPQEPE